MDVILSIIIPVYNVEQYINKCLISVCEAIADRQDIEVLVIDDGSPDRSIEVVQPILDIMPYARLIRQENKGLSEARNTGLDAAKGEYVWFVDSDDWLLNNAIDDVMKVISSNPRVDVIATVLQMNYEGKKPLVRNEYIPEIMNLCGKDYLRKCYPQGASQRFILRRDFLSTNCLRFCKDLLHEDGLFGYTMLYMAKNIVILPNPVYAYRIRQTGSIMSSITMRTPISMLNIHQQLMDFCKASVSAEDRVWYRQVIFMVLVNLFGFSRSLAFNKDFSKFYKSNKAYFNNEANWMLQQGVMSGKARMVRYYPLTMIRIKYLARKILKK